MGVTQTKGGSCTRDRALKAYNTSLEEGAVEAGRAARVFFGSFFGALAITGVFFRAGANNHNGVERGWGHSGSHTGRRGRSSANDDIRNSNIGRQRLWAGTGTVGHSYKCSAHASPSG